MQRRADGVQVVEDRGKAAESGRALRHREGSTAVGGACNVAVAVSVIAVAAALHNRRSDVREDASEVSFKFGVVIDSCLSWRNHLGVEAARVDLADETELLGEEGAVRSAVLLGIQVGKLAARLAWHSTGEQVDVTKAEPSGWVEVAVPCAEVEVAVGGMPATARSRPLLVTVQSW